MKQEHSSLSAYLPSPPHAPFGVTITSLQASACVLYTSSFRGFPSWASISEKKSSACKSTLWINGSSNEIPWKEALRSYILHLATVGLLQRCSHCTAEGRPKQQESWPPHPSRKKWRTNWCEIQDRRSSIIVYILCFFSPAIVIKKLTRTCQTFSFAPR